MKENRLEKIESFIKERKNVSLLELCELFDISISTARRDISLLLSNPNFKKTYGGIVYNDLNTPLPFDERNIERRSEKILIGERAAALINDGDIIYVDSGTTTLQLMSFLNDKNNITIITNSLDVIIASLKLNNIKMIALSGELNKATHSFTGQTTIDVLNDFNINKAFMASNGFTLTNGATQSTSMEFAIKKKVVSKSDEVYLMIDNSKFSNVALFTYASADQFNAIITDRYINNETTKGFVELGGKIITAIN